MIKIAAEKIIGSYITALSITLIAFLIGVEFGIENSKTVFILTLSLFISTLFIYHLDHYFDLKQEKNERYKFYYQRIFILIAAFFIWIIIYHYAIILSVLLRIYPIIICCALYAISHRKKGPIVKVLKMICIASAASLSMAALCKNNWDLKLINIYIFPYFLLCINNIFLHYYLENEIEFSQKNKWIIFIILIVLWSLSITIFNIGFAISAIIYLLIFILDKNKKLKNHHRLFLDLLLIIPII